jgi:hypothetical protein
MAFSERVTSSRAGLLLAENDFVAFFLQVALLTRFSLVSYLIITMTRFTGIGREVPLVIEWLLLQNPTVSVLAASPTTS